MSWRARVYMLHRWIGLLVCVQLLAWSVGGLIFSVLDIRMVRGERDSPMRPFAVLDDELLAGALPPGIARTVVASGEAVATVALVDRGLGPRWELRDETGALLACREVDGTPAPTITREQAVHLARRDFVHEAGVRRVVLIERTPPIEFRGKPLPAWRVELDHPAEPHLYVDARTGEITARRNRAWRVFDFFWMLHTMDYAGRDDFNHPLLTGASVLAIVTAASGLGLWIWRWSSRRSRRRRCA